ncbi:hypothetical protein PR048_002087 [Dryococelus australis]|uniref:HTH CENPB-type domain-containing protein n=1 Tax=Dryococelus australis TaxID=614101 RepID=A0ABQ9IJC0_9NEOP|nr:hypothetical protein PR048_002087 [Dryococelus australis]
MEVRCLRGKLCKKKFDKGVQILRDIRLKAHQIARELNISHRNFKASIGWCVRMTRHSVPYYLYNKTLDYLYSQVGNADETAVYFDMPSNTTSSQLGSE